DGGRIEQGYAQVNGALNGASLLPVVHLPVLIPTHFPATKAERGYSQIGAAHGAVLHSLRVRPRPAILVALSGVLPDRRSHELRHQVRSPLGQEPWPSAGTFENGRATVGRKRTTFGGSGSGVSNSGQSSSLSNSSVSSSWSKSVRRWTA